MLQNTLYLWKHALVPNIRNNKQALFEDLLCGCSVKYEEEKIAWWKYPSNNSDTFLTFTATGKLQGFFPHKEVFCTPNFREDCSLLVIFLKAVLIAGENTTPPATNRVVNSGARSMAYTCTYNQNRKERREDKPRENQTILP